MSDLEFAIKLPEELVRRVELAGIDLETTRPDLIELIEKWIQRKEAMQRLIEIADELQGSLPLEEIEAELAAAKVDRIARDQVGKA